ncbi:transcription factor AP-4 isoform X2 [Anthonomus grandis grandis]|uniref:transcription factor AP-4 isoform X2 n=1 Tax=Anthonomus grandis grandis TaxID=2921223 RepID=UPI0021654F5F|nr:transcription factor AP-4 isoform X2 [Anthonomus grandis grandis]
MAMYIDATETVIFEESGDEKKEILGNLASRINKGGEPPTVSMDQEKRMRREIANSNERRRMQSINNGFQSLRSLLPHHEGEKLSKAAILQQTAEYIYSLEQEKTRLLSQNCQLKRLVGQHEGGELPPKKRLKTSEIILPAIKAESADEGLGSMSPEPVKLITVQVNKTAPSESSSELKMALDRERNLRLLLEDQVRQLEQQLYQHQQQQTVQVQAQTQIQFLADETEEISTLQLVASDSLPVSHTQTVVCSAPPSRCSTPEPILVTPVTEEERLPSVLKAAIKAEPKVEVERLPSPNNGHEDVNAANIYSVSNTSRQNLETIVEAIRHLEGDHMFGDDSTVGASVTVTTSPPDPQEIPLALTTRTDSFIEYSAATVQQHQQSRPGVIVVKQAS